MWKLLLLCAIAQVVHGACPTGFDLIATECQGTYAKTHLDINNVTKVTKSVCNGILGQPVIIHTEEVRTIVLGQASQHFPNETRDPMLVLGLTCEYPDYKWADGSPLDFLPSDHDTMLERPCKSNYRFYIDSDGSWLSWGAGYAFTVYVSCTTKLNQPVPSGNGCESFEDSEDGVCYQVFESAEKWLRIFVINSELKPHQFTIRRFSYSGNGDCLAMDTSTSKGQWMNIDCSTKLPVACVREQKEVTEPTCNAGLSTEDTVITSLGFPYNATTPCEYFLQVNPYQKVEVEISLEANPCCDFVVIHEGFLGGNLIANSTGEQRNVTFYSKTNLMRVSWEPNYGENVKGLEARRKL